jgi:hypothetical protein
LHTSAELAIHGHNVILYDSAGESALLAALEEITTLLEELQTCGHFTATDTEVGDDESKWRYRVNNAHTHTHTHMHAHTRAHVHVQTEFISRKGKINHAALYNCDFFIFCCPLLTWTVACC